MILLYVHRIHAVLSYLSADPVPICASPFLIDFLCQDANTRGRASCVEGRKDCRATGAPSRVHCRSQVNLLDVRFVCESRLHIVLQADTIPIRSSECWLSCSLQVGVHPIGSYFLLLLPTSSFFCVPDVTPNRLSIYPAVAPLILLLRSRRTETVS